MFTSKSIDELRAALANDHKVTPYYKQAEAPELLAIFWGESGLFRPLFNKLDLNSVVDFACGHGRHTAQFIDRAGHVTLVDVVQSNVDACAKRFAGRKNVTCIRNNGRDLAPIRAASQTALFCYDAMVHFEFADMLAYLPEIARVLRSGGRALLHYSANEANPAGSYRDDPRWRNFGSHTTVQHFASRIGLQTLDQFTTSWPPGNGEAAIDGVALFEKS
jgi:ubiquinone/menaquinone biosynthesis C-methylase UbiE